MRRDLAALFDHRLAGNRNRVATVHRAARPAGAAAIQQLVAIALQKPDFFKRHPELVHQHLGKRRPMALAVIQRAGHDGHRAIGLKANAAHFRPRRGGHFQILANAAPAHLAARPACRGPGREAIPIRRRQRPVQHRREVAAIVFHRRRRFIRHHVRRDVVAPTQFDGGNPHFPCRRLDQPLHVVIRLRPPGATIRPHRRGVGQHHLHLHRQCRGAVDADDVLHDVHRRRQGGGVGQHGADIGVAAHPQGEEIAVFVQSQFLAVVMVAPGAVGQEGIRPLIHPFHRPPQRARRQQHAAMFRVVAALHAKASADIAGQHPHLLRRHPHHPRHPGAQAKGALARRVHDVAFAVEQAEDRTRFHRRDNHPAVADFHPRHMRGLGENLIHQRVLAEMPVQHHIARRFVIELRGTGGGGVLRSRHRQQRVDIGEQRLRPIAGLLQGFPHHHRQRLADIAHPALGQRVLHRLRRGGAIMVGAGHVVLHRLDAGGLQIGHRDHLQHPRHRQGCVHIQAAQNPMCHPAAHHHHIGLARQVFVGGVVAFAAQQHRVLPAGYGLAHRELTGRQHVGLKQSGHVHAGGSGLAGRTRISLSLGLHARLGNRRRRIFPWPLPHRQAEHGHEHRAHQRHHPRPAMALPDESRQKPAQRPADIIRRHIQPHGR